mgnify:CR=1 FL=1
MPFTLNKIMLAGMLLSPMHVIANDISGMVVDENNQPIANATVEIVNTNNRVTSNTSGNFRLSDLTSGAIELHITAPNFVHQTLDFDLNKDINNVNVILQPSSLEVIDVFASPFHASVIESSLPITVLAGDALRLAQTSTLGETLNSQAGVHSSYFGGVASSPIIRGLDGPRVMITQNGLDASDVSRVGADHIVAAESATAQQIEVLRGPATLFYGSGAIGGVVNVVDERIPQTNETKARILVSNSSVNSGKNISGAGQLGLDNVVLYADGIWRDADAYKAGTKIDNTQFDGTGFTLGASYLLDNGFVGLSFENTDRQYGLPGHEHGEHEDREDEHDEDHEHDDDHDEDAHDVFSDMQQDRVQLLSDLYFDNQFFSKVSTKLAYTDYTHAEIEEGEVGTRFNNTTSEGKLTFLHQPMSGWKGGVSLHAKYSEFDAVGEEAFTPGSSTRMLGLALMEEKHIGDVLLQVGARIERVTIAADHIEFDPELFADDHMEHAAEHDDHDEDHGVDHDDEHNDEHGDDHSDHLMEFDFDETFTPTSISVGAVWEYTDGYNLGLSLSRAQRAPSSAELLANGLHIGTGSYELGAVYDLHEHDDEMEVELRESAPQLETSNNIDLTLRKFSGDLGFVFNVFYNRVDNYYFEDDLGFTFDAGHDDHGDEHSDEEGAPVFLFTPQDVALYGFEAQVNYAINTNWTVTAQGDMIRGQRQDGGDLARIPPSRISSALNYAASNWDAKIDVKHVFEQDRITTLETNTPAYTMVDISANWYITQDKWDWVAYVKVDNVTDELAQVHQSFLKDITPLPGRNIVLGLRGEF